MMNAHFWINAPQWSAWHKKKKIKRQDKQWHQQSKKQVKRLFKFSLKSPAFFIAPGQPYSSVFITFHCLCFILFSLHMSLFMFILSSPHLSLFMFYFVFSAMVILIFVACWLQVTASHWYVRRFMLSPRVDLGVWRFCGSALSSTSSFWTRCLSAVAWFLRYAARIAGVSVHVWCLLLLPLLILSFFVSIIIVIIRYARNRHVLLPVLHPLSPFLLCFICPCYIRFPLSCSVSFAHATSAFPFPALSHLPVLCPLTPFLLCLIYPCYIHFPHSCSVSFTLATSTFPFPALSHLPVLHPLSPFLLCLIYPCYVRFPLSCSVSFTHATSAFLFPALSHLPMLHPLSSFLLCLIYPCSIRFPLSCSVSFCELLIITITIIVVQVHES